MLSVYFLCASVEPAQAKLYKWKDDSGATHYTDNENNIPFKYRKKESLEKLKGLSKPRSTKGTPDEKSENIPENLSEEEIAQEEEVIEEQVENESIIFLKEVKTFLEVEISKHQKILKAVPADELNGKYIIMPLKARANKKFTLAEKIKKSRIKALKPVSQYLISSASIDQRGELGGNDYLARIVEARNRMESDIFVKEGLIKRVDAEIANSK